MHPAERLAAAEAAVLGMTVQDGTRDSPMGQTALVGDTPGLGNCERSSAELAAFVRFYRCHHHGIPAVAERSPAGHIPSAPAARIAASLLANTWRRAVVSKRSPSALVLRRSRWSFPRIATMVEVVAFAACRAWVDAEAATAVFAVSDTVGRLGPCVGYWGKVVVGSC